MKECEICGRFEELFDAVIEGRPIEICRQCAKLHNAILLEKPSTKKLKDVERLFTVRERLEEASHVKESQRSRSISASEEKTAFPETLSYKLRKTRERAGLSRDKLANELGLSVAEIGKIEDGEQPSEKALKRYGQFFKTKFEVIKEEPREGDEQPDFNDQGISLRGWVEKAKTFFTGKKASSSLSDAGSEEAKGHLEDNK